MTTDELWTQYSYHLRVKRRSPATLRYYDVTRRSLNRYLEGVLPEKLVEQLTTAHLRGFLVWLESQGLAAGGIHAHGRALRAVFSWAQLEGLCERNLSSRLELPTVPKHRLPVADADVVSKLLRVARIGDQPARDSAMLLGLFDTGVRVSELVGLRLPDLELERGFLRVVGKGNKERHVPIGVKAIHAIRHYQRRERQPQSVHTDRLFLGRFGTALTKSGISIRLNHLARSAGVTRGEAAPHAFRRGFAIEFLRNGGDVFTLQQILGHASLDMTRRYVSFLDGDLKTAHVRFSPGDRL